MSRLVEEVRKRANHINPKLKEEEEKNRELAMA